MTTTSFNVTTIPLIAIFLPGQSKCKRLKSGMNIGGVFFLENECGKELCYVLLNFIPRVHKVYLEPGGVHCVA
ncbi:hypothetical protein ACB092_05G280100 [Castanea dentata]